jgi:glycerol-3-phosphate dehydrogenase
MRSRDLERLAASTYDLLVVGGGIHGLTIAYEASSRGLKTALVEAADYGSGSSFNHQRTAHGGLRSLQSGRIDRARHAIYERRALARIAPWLLRPLPFIVGTYSSLLRSRMAFRAAFQIDRWLGRDRNDGVEPELHLPASRLISKAATLRLFPGIRQEGLTGAAQWYDYQMVEADRLTFAFAAAADRAGADLANYVEAISPLREGARIVGMQVADRLSDAAFPIRARMTVNAAGGRAGELAAMFGMKREVPLVKAANLVTSRPARDIALAAAGPSGRMLTLVPWHGRALIGTLQSPGFVKPDATDVTVSELEGWLREVNEAFPALALTRTDVSLVHRGVVPAVAGRNGRPELKPAPEFLDHAAEGAEGAATVIGVKYTTARGLAERGVDAIGRRLRQRLPPSTSATTVLPGAGIADHEALSIETGRDMGLDVPLATIRHLITKYGEAAAAIIRLTGDRPDLRETVAPDSPTLGAEIVYTIRHEQAMRLADAVIRRTALGAMDCPDETALRTSARIAAAELGWDDTRTQAEIELVRAGYVVT